MATGMHRYDFDSQGEQWSATSDKDGWVQVGQKYHNSATTCMTFGELEGGAAPANFGMTNMKKHIMCCVPNEMNA